MKKTVSFCAALLAVLLSFAQVFAFTVTDGRLAEFKAASGSVITAQDRVIDMAGLLDKNEADQLEARADMLSTLYGCGIYVLTVNDIYDFGYTYIENFSEDWFDTIGLGEGSSKNGVLLCISMADRKYDIDAHGNFANTAFTDYGKACMADEFIPSLGSGNWYQGFDIYLDVCESLLSRAQYGDPFDVGDTMLSFAERLQIAATRSLLPAFVIAACAVFIMKGKMGNVKEASHAANYVIPGSIMFRNRFDRYTHTTQVRTPKSTGNRSGGMGGTSIGGGGHSHSSGHF